MAFDHMLVQGLVLLGVVLATLALSFAREGARRARLDRELASERPRARFPIVGYVAWRYASRPAIDVVLRTPIDPELTHDAALAIDASLHVAWPDDRTLRLEMARPDRERLRELFDCLLAPLHHEVGIERVVMADATPDPVRT